MQQARLTAHLRDPEQEAGPDGVEDRRLKVYRELVYNNVQGFWRQGFPVLRSLLDDDRWHAMVRRFLREHRSQSPFFHDISREAVSWLQQLPVAERPLPFIAELAHYEWVELALSIASDEIPLDKVDPNGDLRSAAPAISPLAWCLRYDWPVHRISPGFQPQAPEAEPCHFIVYRDRLDKVRFIDSNALTHALLEGLRHARVPAQAVLVELAELMQHPNPDALQASGMRLLENLRQQGVVMGTWSSDAESVG